MYKWVQEPGVMVRLPEGGKGDVHSHTRLDEKWKDGYKDMHTGCNFSSFYLESVIADIKFQELAESKTKYWHIHRLCDDSLYRERVGY